MKIVYPPYVLKRMIERGITVAEVRGVLEGGEVIEEYKADTPPRYLMLGWSGQRPIHVVAEDDPAAGQGDGGDGLRAGRRALERRLPRAQRVRAI